MLGFSDRQFHANQYAFQNPWRACQLGSGDVDHARSGSGNQAGVTQGICHRGQSTQTTSKPEFDPKIRATPADQVEAWHDLMAGRPFVLSVDGRPQRFTLSLSELYLTTAPTDQRFKKITPQANAQALIQAAKELNPETTGWVIYPEGHADEVQSRQILHKRIHIQSKDRERTVEVASRRPSAVGLARARLISSKYNCSSSVG